MSAVQHVQESAPGVIGTCIAGGFTIAGFINGVLPVLQALSLLAGICVAAVTFIYYWRKVKHHNAVVKQRQASPRKKAKRRA